MAMRNCDECLENNWTFNTLDDGMVQAICLHCTHEVQWMPKPKIKETCKDCGNRLVEKPSRWKAKKAKKEYYYTHTLRCPKCNKSYLAERYKKYN